MSELHYLLRRWARIAEEADKRLAHPWFSWSCFEKVSYDGSCSQDNFCAELVHTMILFIATNGKKNEI